MRSPFSFTGNALRTTSTPSGATTFANGLKWDSTGALCVTAEATAVAPLVTLSGILLDSTGAVVLTQSAPVVWANGLPQAMSGALSSSTEAGQTAWQNGLPFQSPSLSVTDLGSGEVPGSLDFSYTANGGYLALVSVGGM